MALASELGQLGSMTHLVGTLTTALPSDLNLLVADELDSTNRWGQSVTKCFPFGKVPPTVIVGLGQSQGRGRGGRVWQSAKGAGVWATWVGGLPQDRLPSLPIRAAVALCVALEEEGVDGVGLKWPNDVLCQGRKLGGILCHSSVRNGQAVVVCGFGINFLHPGAALDEAIGLQEVIRHLDMTRVMAQCIISVDRLLRTEDSGWQRLRDHYNVHQVGQEIRWHDRGQAVVGDFVGYNRQGHLRLKTAGKEHTYVAGEID